MSERASRRGFLHGLASLPLIGGSVTLVGNPTAVAAAPTLPLLVDYRQWLEGECRILDYELAAMVGIPVADARISMRPGDFHFPRDGRDWRTVPKPSTRADLVLATVGGPRQQGAFLSWSVR